MKGEAWPKHQTLADRLGVSLRSVVSWMAELEAKAYVVATRRQSASAYRMGYAKSACLPRLPGRRDAQMEHSRSANFAHPEPRFLNEPVLIEPDNNNGDVAVDLPAARDLLFWAASMPE
jgi:DNA-binding transcriptional MocR family regulator